MKRIEIELDDEDYERLKTEAAHTGKSMEELIRFAVDDTYGSGYRERLRQALFRSAGIAEPDDFDGLSGDGYIDKVRGGWGDRARAAAECRVGRKERLLRAIRESAGAAQPDDFDGLNGEEYVDMIRKHGVDEHQRRYA
jgi:hypothetical protein